MAELRTTTTDDNEFVLSQELCLRTVIRPQVQAKMQEKIKGTHARHAGDRRTVGDGYHLPNQVLCCIDFLFRLFACGAS